MADSSEPLTQAAVRAEWLALQAARLCGEHREDDAIEVCDEALREDHLCDYALLVRDHACRMELSHAEQLTVEALTSAAKGRFAVALELAKEALKLDDGYECAHRIREFVARARKHGHSNYAAETHKHALKPLKAEAGETKKPVYSETMGETALDLETALQHVASNLGRPVATVRAQLGIGDAARENTDRAKGRPRTKQGNDLTKLSPSQVMAVIDDSTLGRLRRRYATLLEENSNLPAVLVNEDQARKAGALWSTYRALQDRLRRVGLPPIELDTRAATANSRCVSFYRSRKAKHVAAAL